MNGIILRDGLFKVYPDSTIYRKVNGKWEKAHIYEAKLKHNKYESTSAMYKGKQMHAYVHRLLAEALVPNPENKPQVFHKDGNTMNNDVSNLIWVTPKERVSLIYQIGRGNSLENNGKPCKICGELTMAKDNVCRTCKQQEKIYRNKIEYIEKMKNKFKDVKLEELSERDLKVVEMRSAGYTLQQIGDQLGIVRERVRQIEERILTKYNAIKKVKEVIGREEIEIEEIKSIRGMLGWSMLKMAKTLDMSNSTYKSMELNPENFKVKHIKKISEVFNLKINIGNE